MTGIATDDYLAITQKVPADYLAYHEAGHAIIAHIFGQVDFITAGSPWEMRDGWLYQEVSAECFAALDNDLDRAIFCCGGGAALIFPQKSGHVKGGLV